ncbi:MAG: hypothetical protein EA001_08975 [Oscillatoriales cyanobacterium]|nr:MAG: hypothetical protein EA001_08975 [Oscillatoriales cyanobacterium]
MGSGASQVKIAPILSDKGLQTFPSRHSPVHPKGSLTRILRPEPSANCRRGKGLEHLTFVDQWGVQSIHPGCLEILGAIRDQAIATFQGQPQDQPGFSTG